MIQKKKYIYWDSLQRRETRAVLPELKRAVTLVKTVRIKVLKTKQFAFISPMNYFS